MQGAEDGAVVLLDPYGLATEYITRGRNTLVIVTTQGKERYAEEWLLAAAAHEDPGYTCEEYEGEEERCPYIGQKLLDTIQMGVIKSESGSGEKRNKKENSGEVREEERDKKKEIVRWKMEDGRWKK